MYDACLLKNHTARNSPMRQRAPSSLLGGDANCSFSLLAREVRARQRLACSTQLPAAVAAATKDFNEVRSSRSGEEDDESDVACDRRHLPSRNKEGHKSRRGGKGRRRRRNKASMASVSTTKKIGNNDYGVYRAATGIDHTIDPSVESTMLRVFSGDGASKRGVSVSAVRRLYRKRHEEEKSKALAEVRRWWRVGRSEAAPLAEATVAASLMLASGTVACNTEGTYGLPHDTVELGTGGRLPKDVNGTLACKMGDGGDVPKISSPSPHQTSHENIRECQSQQQPFVVDGLYWRQVLQDPLYAAGVVRGIKQALRRPPSFDFWRADQVRHSAGVVYLVDSSLVVVVCAEGFASFHIGRGSRLCSARGRE